MSQTTTIKSVRKRVSMEPGQMIVQSTPVGTRSLPMSMSRRSTNVVSSSRGMGSSIVRPQGEVGRLSHDTFETISGSRGKEKKDLNDLNSRLANYLENTRYLEANVKALTDELERLKKFKGLTQERVRDEYKSEMEEYREALASIKKELAELLARNLALEDKLDTKDDELESVKRQREELRAELAKLSNLVGELEGELCANRRNVENLEREKKQLKEDVERLRSDNDRVRCDCEAARCKQMETQHERDAILAEQQLDAETYNAEIDEQNQVIEELRKVTPMIQSRWKSEYKDMISALQDDYNERIAIMENECQSRYEVQLNQMQNALRRDNTDGDVTKTENKTLKKQLGPLKDKARDLEDELHQIQNAQVRDNTDNITKTENKTLKSSLSQNKSKLSNLESENDRLRRELDDLRAKYEEECDDCEAEKNKLRADNAELCLDLETCAGDLTRLRSDHLNMSLEISCYRKLLEGEERKMGNAIEQQSNMQSSGGAALASIIGGGGGGGQASQSSNPQKDKPATKPAGQQPPKNKAPAVSESSGTVRMQRTMKGHVGIKEVDQSGYYIVLNNSKRTVDVNLEGWTLERKYGRNNEKTSRFVFPKNTILKGGQDLKIYASGHSEDAEQGDIVTDRGCKTFGNGNGSVHLTDPTDETKAHCAISYQ